MSGAMPVKTPLMQLQDPRQATVLFNQSLAVAPTASPLLQQRAANQRARIDDMATEHARRYAVVGLQPVEPIGAARLAALAESRATGVTA